MAKAIFNFEGTYDDFIQVLDPMRDDDDIARKVLVRKCVIRNIPKNISSLFDAMGVENCLFSHCTFIAEK